MMITELTADEVVGYCRFSLGIGAEPPQLDDILLAGLCVAPPEYFAPVHGSHCAPPSRRAFHICMRITARWPTGSIT